MNIIELAFLINALARSLGFAFSRTGQAMPAPKALIAPLRLRRQKSWALWPPKTNKWGKLAASRKESTENVQVSETERD